MATLGPGQIAMVMPHYPHMMAEDTIVWTKFLTKDSKMLKEVWYDVRVGLSVPLPLGASVLEQRISDGLTRKRIDVVARVAGGIWIIEVKPFASMYGLGQVLTYQRLFVQEYEHEGDVIPVIICDQYDEDLLDEYDEFGVLVLKNS